MRTPLKALLGLAAAATFVSFAVPAGAITGGGADGDQHPNVGIVVFYSPDGDTNARFRCSGTLISPTVVITAAHCTAGTVGKTIVTFDSVIAENPPSPIPRAADDPGDGTSSIGYTTTPAGYYAGTAHTHPQYSDFTDVRNWNDVGVVVLDSPVTGIAPAQLAPRNYLDAYAQPVLNKTIFTLVGYGTEVRKPDSGPQKPTPMSYPLIRRNTTAQGPEADQPAGPDEREPEQRDRGGGTCFGDSGGPSFLNGNLVTVTSYGYTANCRYLGGYQRVDIPVVQDWLAPFLNQQ